MRVSLEMHDGETADAADTRNCGGWGSELCDYPSVLMGSLVKCTAYKRMLKKCAAHVRGWTLWLDFRVFIRVTFTSFTSDNIAHHESSPRLTNSKCTWLEVMPVDCTFPTIRKALAYKSEWLMNHLWQQFHSSDTELRWKSGGGDKRPCNTQETFGVWQENTIESTSSSQLWTNWKVEHQVSPERCYSRKNWQLHLLQ